VPIAPLLRFVLLLFILSTRAGTTEAQAQQPGSPIPVKLQLRETPTSSPDAPRPPDIGSETIVFLSMPDDLSAVSGRTFRIPVDMKNYSGLRFEALEFGIDIDPTVVEIIGVTTTNTLSDGWTINMTHTVGGAHITANGGVISDSSGTLLELIARAAIPAGMDGSFEILQRMLRFQAPMDFGPDVYIMYTSGVLTISGDCVEPLKWTAAPLPFAPNPFNSFTAATLRVDEESVGKHAVVDVLNMHGHRVGILFDGPLTSGTHTLRVDGSQLSSGVYFVRMKIGMLHHIRSIRLVK